MELKLNDGKTLTLRKPTAGIRNRALAVAETADGVRQSVMMIEMVPHCIAKHPWGVRPIKQCLDSLSIKEYDSIVESLADLMDPPNEEDAKNSETPSETKNIQAGGGDKRS